jgi:uncharacterized membrane protein (DUF2068 family)
MPVLERQVAGDVDNWRFNSSTEAVEAMENPTEPGTTPEVHEAIHDRGLLAIGFFKLAKAIFFFCLGIGAFRLLHRDLTDEVMKLATALRFDTEGRLVGLVLEKVDLIDAHRLKQIGFATFGYSALALTEGCGLLLEKPWAEYLTLILTISFLPWEIYELIAHPNWMRLGLLLINLAVLGYLVWLLQRKKKRETPLGVPLT